MMRVLRDMGCPTDSWNDLIYLVTGKLVHNKEWEDSIIGYHRSDISILQRWTEFLEHRCILKAINRKTSSLQSQTKISQAKISTLVSAKAASCPKSKESSDLCQQAFLELSPEDRKFIKDTILCWNCLKVFSHMAKNCKFGTCRLYGKQHNSLLHISRR